MQTLRRSLSLGSSVRPTARRSVCRSLVAAVFASNPGRRKTFPEFAHSSGARSAISFTLSIVSWKTPADLAPCARVFVGCAEFCLPEKPDPPPALRLALAFAAISGSNLSASSARADSFAFPGITLQRWTPMPKFDRRDRAPFLAAYTQQRLDCRGSVHPVEKCRRDLSPIYRGYRSRRHGRLETARPCPHSRRAPPR
jgi:hypothetical protein